MTKGIHIVLTRVNYKVHILLLQNYKQLLQALLYMYSLLSSKFLADSTEKYAKDFAYSFTLTIIQSPKFQKRYIPHQKHRKLFIVVCSTFYMGVFSLLSEPGEQHETNQIFNDT